MARQNWEELHARFLAEYAETGISPKAWCEREGLAFSSAKRYIKIAGYKTANSQKKQSANSQKKAPKKTANSQIKNPQKVPAAALAGTAAKTSPALPERAAVAPADYGISEQQALFADHVVQGKSRVDAYRLAGYSGEGNVAYAGASQVLRNIKVSRYLHALRNERQKRYAVELDDLITQLTAIVNADPNALSQYRRVNCRYCWGDNHKYQWRDIEEQLQAEKRAEIDKNPPPDVSGGVGFVDNSDPNPDCPRCLGEGRGEAYFPDTRDIEGDERHLFQGVKVTMNGVQIAIADKDAARRELARLLVVRGADSRQTELNIERLELQNQKLAAEIADIRRNTPPDEPPNPDGVTGDLPPEDAAAQYRKLMG
ncbi:terminase small subunit [Lelliottia wanjuensis]|uniref:terminase small subunit n=1 Tax=Lelliottia wanjuensis TaxID=3050585 RepID=UPI00254B4F31|nr:terminase small subunit [Lelliottia sp. V86_10]MDK9585424.1 terminase small subunit [Lelliottia sp. V86_10]